MTPLETTQNEGQEIRILHIEDNLADAVLFKEYLHRTDGNEQWSIVHAKNLDEGVQYIGADDFDLIVLDLGLPRVSGLDGVKEIINIQKDICLVVVSGNENLALAKEAIQLGAQDFLKKADLSPYQIEKTILFSLERTRLKRKLAEQERRLELERNQLVVSQSLGKIGSLYFDSQNSLASYISPEVYNIFGFDQQKRIARKDFTDSVHPEDRAEFLEKINRLSSGTSLEYKFRIERNDQIRFIKLTSSAQKEKGQLLGTLVLLQDITDDEIAKRQIKESELKLRTIFENATVGIVYQDHEGQIIDVNLKAAKILGIDHPELEKKSVADDDWTFVDEKGNPLTADDMPSSQVLKYKKPVNGMVIGVHNPKAQEVRELSIDSFPLKSPQTGLINTCTIFTDVTETRRQEHQIKRSEAQLKTAQQIAKFGHWIYDYATDEYQWSDAAYEIFELKRSEIPSRGLFEQMLHPDDKKRISKEIKAARKHFRNAHLEFRIITPKGKVKYLEDSWETNCDEHGEPTTVLGVFHDITFRKSIELKLHETKDKLASILDSIDDIVIILDEDLSYREVFPGGTKEDLRYEPQDLIGMSLKDTLPEGIYKEYLEKNNKLLKTKRTQELTYSLDFAEGVRWFNAKMSPIFGREGDVMGTTLVIRNITKQKEDEIALAASEEKFRFQSEFLPHIVWTSNKEGKTNYVNEVGRSFYGKGLIDFEEGNWENVHPEDKERSQEKWFNAVDNKSSYFNLERHLSADGKYYWLDIKANPIFDKDGDVISWLGVSTNVNVEIETKMMNEKLVDDLKVRVRQATCLYRISHLSATGVETTEDILKEAVEIIREGLSDPDDSQVRIIYGNETYSTGRFYGKNFYDQPIRLDSGKHCVIQVYIKGVDLQMNKQILFDEEELIESVSENLALILNQKDTIRLIAESEQRFRTILERATVGICLLKDFKIYECNTTFANMLNMEIDEVLGMTPVDISPVTQKSGQDSRKAAQYWVEQAIKSNGVSFEWQHKTKDEEVLDCDIHLLSMSWSDGEYVLAFVRDMTHELQAQRALAQSEKKYRSIFENIKEGYVLIDSDGELLNINPSGARILAVDESQAIGEKIEDLIHAEKHFYRPKNKKDKLIKNKEVSLVNAAGAQLHLNFNIQQISQEGKPFLYEATFSDITERARFNLVLNQSLELYEAYNQGRENLIKTGLKLASELSEARCAYHIGVDRNQEYAELSVYGKKKNKVNVFSKRFPAKLALALRNGEINYKDKSSEVYKMIKELGLDEDPLIIPFVEKDKFNGLLAVCHRETEFTELDKELLTNFANLFDSLVIRKELEEEYIGALNTLEQSQEIGKIGSYRIDYENNRRWWSDRMYKLYGLDPTKDKIPVDHWENYTHPDDREAHRLAYEKGLQQGGMDHEYRIVLSNGEIRHIAAKSEVIYNAEGKPISEVGQAQDITPLKNALELVRIKSQQLENIVSSLPGIVYRVNYPSNKILFLSDFAEEMLGYDIDELKFSDKGLVELVVHPDDIITATKEIEEALMRHSSFSVIFRMVTKAGKVLWVSNTGRLVETFEEEHTVEGYIHDITDRIKSEERVMNAFMEASDAERARISKEIHDSLQQTLTIASLNLEFVRNEEERLTSKAREKFDIAYDYLKRSLDDSRGIAHRLMPKAIEDFGFVSVAKSMVNDLNKAGRGNFEFITNMEHVRFNVPLDTNLYKTLQEATNNILKHAKAENITIQYIKLGDKVQLSIEDDGVGFNKEKLNISRKGFGLTNMKSRVASLGADVYIDSHPGHGTTIMIEFPYNEELLLV